MSSTGGRRRILLVDDDAPVMTALGEMIAECGHEALTAGNFGDALRLFRSAKPDCVLLDVMMPTVDGFKLARMFKSEAVSFVPVILLTALDDIESKRRGMASGADDFLSKPVSALELQIRLSSMLRIKELTDKIHLMNAQLAEIAVTDALTSLFNRRALSEHLEREFSRSRRYGHVMAVLIFDLDHFKSINDTHGHAVGDRVLQIMGSTLRATIRDTDITGRYGGEEFLVVAPETPPQQALVLADRIRLALEERTRDQPDLPRVTTSVGIATSRSTQASSWDELVQIADAALYEAKRKGRNCCVLAG
jgi:diguanylate cyclase (GGDEF)-like protein